MILAQRKQVLWLLNMDGAIDRAFIQPVAGPPSHMTCHPLYLKQHHKSLQ